MRTKNAKAESVAMRAVVSQQRHVRLRGLPPAPFAGELSPLLSASETAVMDRLKGLYDQATGNLADRIVLFGAGVLGRRTLRLLRGMGVEPLAFGDNNPALWGKEVDGLAVRSAPDVVRRWAGNAAFVVTVFRGFGARTQLAGLGCALVVPYTHLYWRHEEVMTPYEWLFHPSATLAGGDAARRSHRLWADAQSTRIYASQIDWRLSFDYSVLPPPTPENQIYFPPEVTPMDDEVFVDCGAFDGDTLQDFAAKREGRFSGYFALEPDPANYDALRRRVARMGAAIEGRTTVLNLAASSRPGFLRFDAKGTPLSTVTADGGVIVESRSLDSVLWAQEPSYIKMDVEGAELDALHGAEEVIREHRPVLAVCLYHRPSDLWTIPAYIDSLGCGYKLLLRAYAEDCWELVIYAVPEERYRP